MGMFVFIPNDTTDKATRRMLLHETYPRRYDAFCPASKIWEREKNISYYSFITERWADALAEKIKEKQR